MTLLRDALEKLARKGKKQFYARQDEPVKSRYAAKRERRFGAGPKNPVIPAKSAPAVEKALAEAPISHPVLKPAVIRGRLAKRTVTLDPKGNLVTEAKGTTARGKSGPATIFHSPEIKKAPGAPGVRRVVEVTEKPRAARFFSAREPVALPPPRPRPVKPTAVAKAVEEVVRPAAEAVRPSAAPPGLLRRALSGKGKYIAAGGLGLGALLGGGYLLKRHQEKKEEDRRQAEREEYEKKYKVAQLLKLAQTTRAAEGLLTRFGRNMGRAFLQKGPGIAAAAAGTGVLLGGARLYEKMRERSDERHDFDKMVEAHPSLRGEDPDKLHMRYNTLRSIAPVIANDPFAAGSVMKQWIEYPTVTAATLLEAAKVQQASGKGVDLTKLIPFASLASGGGGGGD